MDKNEMDYAEKLIQNTGKNLLALENPLYSTAKNYYALSCTRNADNYMHFKAYGDDCNGVAIGINTKFIEDSMPTINCATMLHYHLFFDNVSYDDEEYQKHIIGRYLQMKRTIDKSNDRKLADAYNSYLGRIKRREFASEEETRLLYRQDYGGRKTTGEVLKDGGYFHLDDFMLKIGLEKSTQLGMPNKFKITRIGNRKRKYYELSLKEFGINNVIKSITIGPNTKLDEQLLTDYLKS